MINLLFIEKAVSKNSVDFSIRLIYVTGGDPCLHAGKTPQTLKASRRLTGRFAESDRLQ